MNRLKYLNTDPIPLLMEAQNPALLFFVRRDLLEERTGPASELWELPEPTKALRRQQADGSWRFPGMSQYKYPAINHDLYETFKQLRMLVEKYGFNRSHPAIHAAAEYLFSCRTAEGDLRGILGNQHMPYYNGVILDLLNQAGYTGDKRALDALAWLKSYRVDDGGWFMPMLTADYKDPSIWSAPPLPLDRSQRSSHNLTGMALRGFVSHPRYRKSRWVRAACILLKESFFKPDRYGFRKAPSYWTKFQYPFFWSSLLTAMDSLSLAGFSDGDEDIRRGIDWFASNQGRDGLWYTMYEKTKTRKPKDRDSDIENRMWIALAVCRMLRRLQEVSCTKRVLKKEGKKS
ncbi:MAG: hypothetical protein ABIK28_23430 [Planctomycetota bacterium]